MTPLQFKKRIAKLFPSQTKAGAALGVRQGTISLWSNGFRPIPRYVEIILKCIEAGVIGEHHGDS